VKTYPMTKFEVEQTHVSTTSLEDLDCQHILHEW